MDLNVGVADFGKRGPRVQPEQLSATEKFIQRDGVWGPNPFFRPEAKPVPQGDLTPTGRGTYGLPTVNAYGELDLKELPGMTGSMSPEQKAAAELENKRKEIGWTGDQNVRVEGVRGGNAMSVEGLRGKTAVQVAEITGGSRVQAAGVRGGRNDDYTKLQKDLDTERKNRDSLQEQRAKEAGSANVNVGSFQQGIDLSSGALQVLGTPDRSVVFTSYDNESVGKDTNTLVTTPAKGNWGGIVFRADSDYEAAGIFLNYVNHADITYGGGQVVVNSISQVYTPIHLEQARPTLSYNTILASADAVISADPNSFEESLVRGDTYTADYRRMGPDLEGNKFSDGATTGLPENSINGLFVRIATNAGSPIDTMPCTAPESFLAIDSAWSSWRSMKRAWW